MRLYMQFHCQFTAFMPPIKEKINWNRSITNNPTQNQKEREKRIPIYPNKPKLKEIAIERGKDGRY